MPAALSVRIAATCNASGQGELTVTLINSASGETVTVDIDIIGGGYSVEFPTVSSPHVLSVANGVYIVSVTGSTSGTGEVYMNSSGTPSLDGEIEVNCTPVGGGYDPSCMLFLEPAEVTPAALGLSDGQVIISASGSGTLEYKLNAGAWQLSNTFTGLAAGSYTAYIRESTNTTCATSVSFVVAEVGTLSVSAIPSRDWLPAGLPVMYSFTAANPSNPTPLVIEIMVSANGTNFTTESSAGLILLEADAAGNYSVNIARYLRSTFAPGFPQNGVDTKLWKYYYLKVWELADYEAEEPATITTTPARVINATVLTPLSPTGTTTLTQQPEEPLYDSGQGISTYIDHSTGTIINTSSGHDPAIGSNRCPKYPVTFYWLNRWCGWQTMTFEGKHEYSDEVGEAVLYKDSAGSTHVASIPNVEKRVAVKSGLVPNNYYDLACSIRYAIRVYQDIDGGWYEGRIEGGSFPTRKEGERLRECNFTFVYSETLAIQQA